MTEIEAAFEITGWDQQPYDEPAEGPALSRATVRKRFSGALAGESVAEVLICGEAGYVVSERVTGTLDGRAGTFVLQHGAATDGTSFGHVVPGSGTGALTGLRGTALVAHERLARAYELDG
jgi:hypothetical protein